MACPSLRPHVQASSSSLSSSLEESSEEPPYSTPKVCKHHLHNIRCFHSQASSSSLSSSPEESSEKPPYSTPNICKHHMYKVARAIHIYVYTVYIYGILSREITIHTVIYGVHIRFWPTLHMHKFWCFHFQASSSITVLLITQMTVNQRCLVTANHQPEVPRTRGAKSQPSTRGAKNHRCWEPTRGAINQRCQQPEVLRANHQPEVPRANHQPEVLIYST